MQQHLTVTFGTYALDATHNIVLNGWREIHGAERELTILKTVGNRGNIVLNSKFNGKILELTGGIECDDPIQEVRDFLSAMVEEGQPLIIDNNDGEFVYDGVYVMNTDELFEMKRLLDPRLIKFRIIFFCPKGFARSTSQITQTSLNITALPYSSSITIDGDTNPEPVISITLVDASTIENIYFTNLTTNQQISVVEQDFEDGDILVFDTANKQVLLNTTAINFDGIFPDFSPGLNNYQLAASGDTSNLLIDQSAYNSEVTVYADKEVAQSIELAATAAISQLSILVKKVAAAAFQLYDDFADNSIASDHWTTSGQVEETGQRLRIYERKSGVNFTSNATTNDKTGVTPPGEPVTGFQVDVNGSSTLNDGLEFQIGVTDGTHTLWFVFGGSTGKMVVRQSGGYYGGSTDLTGQFNTPSQVKLLNVGSDIEAYADGVLVLTLSGKNIKPNSYFFVQASRSSGSSSIDTYFEIDNVYLYDFSTANSDLQIEIQTDATGDPSGTEVTNAVITIPASEIGTDFVEIIKEFSTEPTLTLSTVYHLRVFQAGGDVSNYYVLKKQNTNVYADGNLETTTDGGSNWTQVTGEDLYMKIWSTLPTGFELEQAIAYFASYLNVG